MSVKGGCGRADCSASSGVLREEPTFGRGGPDDNGYFDEPCHACARAFERACPQYAPCWPPEEKIEAGDEVRCEPRPPNRRQALAVSGPVVDVLNGGDGLNILCPLPDDPGRIVRVWQRDYDFQLVRKAIPVLPLKDPSPGPKQPPTAHHLARLYAERGLDDSHAWSQFVIDRALRPEMDMKVFVRIVAIYR